MLRLPQRFHLVCTIVLILAGCSPSLSPTVSVSPTDVVQQIETLVDQMQQAVLAGDKKTYLAHVDLSDPVFAVEHQRWVDGWSAQPPTSFRLTVEKPEVNGTVAEGNLTMRWSTRDQPEIMEASFPAEFHLDKEGNWRYAGEAWTTTEVEHFRVHTWPNTQEIDFKLSQDLPKIYAHVTTSLNYQPDHVMEIKLYDSEAALIANTLLHLPHAHGWNEPGESLKLVADPNDTLLNSGVAHEFTHFIEFEWAGTAHSRFPWWLSEGLAVYVGSHFEPQERIDERLNRVRESALGDNLLDWNSISDFETTPVELWRPLYAQGYAFVRYVTEIYGVDQRNEWLRVMATEMDLEQATQAVLNTSFDQLDAQFRVWLKFPK